MQINMLNQKWNKESFTFYGTNGVTFLKNELHMFYGINWITKATSLGYNTSDYWLYYNIFEKIFVHKAMTTNYSRNTILECNIWENDLQLTRL